MLKTEKNTIPVKFLPKGWKKKAAEELNYSESMIRRVAQGHVENILIFEYLVTEVEKWKKKRADLKHRLTIINK